MAKTKEEINRESRERMAAYRKTPQYRQWLEQSRELRKQLKAKYRRQAGAKPRVPKQIFGSLVEQSDAGSSGPDFGLFHGLL